MCDQVTHDRLSRLEKWLVVDIALTCAILGEKAVQILQSMFT